MKLRTYVITEGDYSSYRIKCILKGPESPALSTLKKQFDSEYGFHPVPDEVHQGEAYVATFAKAYWAQVQLRNDGLKKEFPGLMDYTSWFIAWLKRDHGFVVDPNVKEFHV